MQKRKENISRFREFLSVETPKKYGAVFAMLLITVLILEVFVFNFKWLNSAFDNKIQTEIMAISGATLLGDNISFLSDTAILEYNNLNEKVKYLYFRPGEEKGNKADITLSAIDEANSVHLSVPMRTVLTDVKQSQYIRLHFNGEVKELSISVKGLSGRTVALGDIGLNVSVPLMFSWIRFVVLYFALIFLYLLRPKSFIYKYKTDLKKRWQRIIVVLILVAQVVVFWNMIHLNSDVINWHNSYEHHRQYYELTNSMKNGHFYLDKEPPQALKNLRNPYDTAARSSINFNWDTAFYDGKYYVYFGVLPALIFYLPYNLITGKHIPNFIVLYFCGILMMISIMFLLWQIIKKWYKSTPFVLYLMMCLVFSAACGLAYIIQKPDFYSIPVVLGVVFGMFGLSFWLAAENTNKYGEKNLSIGYMTAGSWCIALVAASRPQILIAILFGIVLFWNTVFRERNLFSKSSIKQTIAICLPFALVATGVMWYNYARFGSIFDFGANYNLTTNDMTQRGFVFGRCGLAIYSFFFQPLDITAVYPFLVEHDIATIYQGLTLTEKMLGGVFWLCPIILIGAYGLFKKNIFNEKIEYRIILISYLSAVVLAVMDAQMAGILMRYYTDFMWLLLIGSSMTLFASYEKRANNKYARNKLINIFLFLSVLTIALSVLEVCSISGNSIMEANPSLFYKLGHLIAFWM